jgi:cytochrome c biogenesis DsbD-like protein
MPGFSDVRSSTGANVKSYRLIFFLLTLGLFSCLFLVAQEESAPQGRTFVTALPTSTVVVSPGGRTPVQFTFRVQNPYHINSNHPTLEELIPTQLHFSLPGEVAIGKMQYPAGTLMSFPFDPNVKLSVYSGDFVVRGVVVAPTQASTGTYTIHAELKYQACDNNSCYPPKKLPFTFNVKVGTRSAGVKKARPTATSPHIHN